MSLIFLFIAQIWASPLPEQDFALALAKARRPADVERLRAEYSRRKIADTACRVELREHLAPVACYEAIALEPAGESRERAARLKHLDRLCREAAEGLRIQEPTRFISQACAKSLVSAREIQKYREDEGADWSGY